MGRKGRLWDSVPELSHNGGCFKNTGVIPRGSILVLIHNGGGFKNTEITTRGFMPVLSYNGGCLKNTRITPANPEHQTLKRPTNENPSPDGKPVDSELAKTQGEGWLICATSRQTPRILGK